jgi:sugar O-acyltransferase (sialic acid O-acetyltransferase NeuD family)
MKNSLVLLGAGGHAKVVLDTLHLVSTYHEINVYDDNPSKLGSRILGYEVCVPIQLHIDLPMNVHVAIGDNLVRRRLGEEILNTKMNYLVITHPTAIVSKFSRIGKGVFIAAGATIAPDAVLDDGVIINHHSVIDHDCSIGSWTHIAPGVVLGGGVIVGKNCLIGAGAVILPGIQIADDVVVGAGAVVTSDIAKGLTVVGVPAHNNRIK